MKPPLRQGSPDDFQTPPEALAPILAYLKKEWIVWECAAGKGNLQKELKRLGYSVIGSDIISGNDDIKIIDFLKEIPLETFDCVITNPPFKHKQQFLERCYEIGKPFALLLPLTTFETEKRQKLFREKGLEVIFMPKRINFETPNKIINSSSWFATAWFTWGLEIGKEMTFSVAGASQLKLF